MKITKTSIELRRNKQTELNKYEPDENRAYIMGPIS